MKPVAGRTHHLVLSKGAPGSETLQGLMLPDLKSYVEQPYVPFAPTAGEGEATNRDTNVTATWEKQQDFSGGVGKLIERKTEDNGYAYSFANCAANGKTGATLFSGMAGCLMPPAAWTGAGIVNNAKQFCEFAGSGTNRYYFMTTDSPRKLYKYDSDGDTPSEVTLPTTGDLSGDGKQLYTDGTSLYITQGAAKNVIKTTNETDWAAYQVGSPLANVNADFLCCRDDGAIAYVTGATLTPGTGAANSPTYVATTVGASGTIATGMVFYKGALWIGKPEGLFSWYQGKVDKRFDAMEHQSTYNFTKMAIHHDLLYFNVKNQLYYTDGDRYVQIFPNDAGGFANIASLFPTSGPLLIGGKLLTQAQGQTPWYFPKDGEDDATVGSVAWENVDRTYAKGSDYASAAIGQASSTKSPKTAQNQGIVGTTAWTSPNNVFASDNQYAQCVLTSYGYSDRLQLRHFDFAIPASATILGIAVTVEGNIPGGTGNRIGGFIVKGGTQYGGLSYRLVSEYLEDVSITVGNNFSLWDTTWTPADINADTFGVNLYAHGAGFTVNLDSVTVTVYYTEQSHYLKLIHFDIALPTNATPVGVMVDVDSYFGYANTFTAKLVKGGVISGNAVTLTPAFPVNGVFELGTELHFTGGSATSLTTPWNVALTRDDVLADTFGIVLTAMGNNRDVRVNAVRLTVFYTMQDVDREQLFLFWGPDAPGLNPIWSDADGIKSVLAIGATSLFDSTGERIYFCCNDAVNAHKIKYFAMTPRYVPASFRTDTAWNFASYIELTEFSAAFRTVPKWWYEVVLNVRDPLATTYAKVDYCIDNGPWEECVDEEGNPATLALDERTVGCFFPGDTTGMYVALRIYLWTTVATSPTAKITHVTLRGMTKPKLRMQFSFPVNCSEKVQPLQGEEESGEVVHDFIYGAARQGYPCKLQDPWGDWHLVAFREPGPLRTIKEHRLPERDAPLRVFTIVQCVLMEIDPLTSDAEHEAWQAG